MCIATVFLKPLHICIHKISFYQQCESMRDMRISQREHFSGFVFTKKKKKKKKTRLWRRCWEGVRTSPNIVDDHTINLVFEVKAENIALHPILCEKNPTTSGNFLPTGGPALYSSLSILFDFLCSMELFTLFSASVSLPYLFSNLWALGADTGWPLFKCLLHSGQLSLQQW